MILEGRLVRLEPLGLEHVPALVAAAAESRESYAFTPVPDGDAAMRAYVDDALAETDHIPFATRWLPRDRVVGTTRFKETTPWAWPPGHPHQRFDRPDIVSIGNTWLSASAQGSGVNTEAKLLMLTHAFDVWEVYLVRTRIDSRNERSRRAIERLGFTLEGIRRADMPGVDGVVRDSAQYSMTREECRYRRSRI